MEHASSVPSDIAAPTTGASSTDSGAGMVFNGHHWTVGGAPLSSPGKRLGAALLESVLMVFTLFLGWLIWSAVLWSRGQSPAKSLMGMRCVKKDTGRAATWGTMVLRDIVGKTIIGSLTGGITSIISCFMILGAHRQGIWDKIAGTVVVDDPQRRIV